MPENDKHRIELPLRRKRGSHLAINILFLKQDAKHINAYCMMTFPQVWDNSQPFTYLAHTQHQERWASNLEMAVLLPVLPVSCGTSPSLDPDSSSVKEEEWASFSPIILTWTQQDGCWTLDSNSNPSLLSLSLSKVQSIHGPRLTDSLWRAQARLKVTLPLALLCCPWWGWQTCERGLARFKRRTNGYQ